jgi:hypothetical protein
VVDDLQLLIIRHQQQELPQEQEEQNDWRLQLWFYRNELKRVQVKEVTEGFEIESLN